MLVLTRKRDEEIVIIDEKGNRVVITVLKIGGDKVSLGVDADATTLIYRKELLRDDLAFKDVETHPAKKVLGIMDDVREELAAQAKRAKHEEGCKKASPFC